MVFQQSFLGKRSESLYSIDIHVPIRKLLSMVDPPMFEPIGDRAVIAPEFIRVNETSLFHFLDRQLETDFTLDIGDNRNGNLPASFQDAEHRNLSCGSPATFPLSPPAKI